MAIILPIRSVRFTFALLMLRLPLSIRLISNTSLIRLSKYLLELDILRKHSDSFSGSSLWDSAIIPIPTMAFIGVRISWLIRDKKSLFALLASFAFLTAFSSFLFCAAKAEAFRRCFSSRAAAAMATPCESTPISPGAFLGSSTS